MGLRPPTADYGVTLPLGIITFTLIWFNKFKHNKPKALWADMCSPLPPWLPIWLPINLISEIAVPISLSLRLFANVLSGTVMMALIYGLLSKFAFLWPGILHAYFDLFSGFIQALVFTLNFDYKITKDISYKTRFYYFTGRYEYVQMDWENTLNFQVSKYISTKLFFHTRFDDLVEPAENWKYMQFKQYLMLGLNYTW